MLVIVALATWFFAGADDAIKVRTAPVVAIGSAGPEASVLDASGYVVARRMATVSAKITGRVLDVLIEEGMRVEEGQILARLDPVDANAQYAWVAAQWAAAKSAMASLARRWRLHPRSSPTPRF